MIQTKTKLKNILLLLIIAFGVLMDLKMMRKESLDQ